MTWQRAFIGLGLAFYVVTSPAGALAAGTKQALWPRPRPTATPVADRPAAQKGLPQSDSVVCVAGKDTIYGDSAGCVFHCQGGVKRKVNGNACVDTTPTPTVTATATVTVTPEPTPTETP